MKEPQFIYFEIPIGVVNKNGVMFSPEAFASIDLNKLGLTEVKHAPDKVGISMSINDEEDFFTGDRLLEAWYGPNWKEEIEKRPSVEELFGLLKKPQPRLPEYAEDSLDDPFDFFFQ